MGYALDVGLTITEGVANGLVEDSFTPRLHYSGALNSGMSGGPALDGRGVVVGVNVSNYYYSQLVSFLVPATMGAELLAQKRRPPVDFAGEDPDAAPNKAETNDTALKESIGEQLVAHSKQLLSQLDEPIPTQSSSGYLLPRKLASFVDCSANGQPDADAKVEQTRISCSAGAALYVKEDLGIGEVSFAHDVFSTEKLGAWRFARRLSFNTDASVLYGDRKYVGPFACRRSTVALDGLDAYATICSRAYRDFEGLFDLLLRVVSLNEPKRGFSSQLNLLGVEFDDGMSLIGRYLAAIQWAP